MDKFIHRNSGCTDQAAEGAFGNLFVVRNGERGVLALFNQDDVAASLSGDLPAERLERADDLAPTQ